MDKLIIRVENSWSYVDRGSPKEQLKWLHKLLAVKLESMANGEYTTWERYLFSLRSYKFPSGMVPFVIENAKKKLLDIDWDWKRSPPDGDVTIEDISSQFPSLNQHQIEALEVMRNHPVGIIKHPTGAGKSFLAIAFAYSIPHSTLFMANEISLLYQTKAEWEKRTGEKAGIIGDGKFEIEKFTVASFDTLYSHRKNLDLHAYLNSVGCIFIDEAQISAARTYWTMIMAIPAYYRYGLSATPYGRSDGMDPYICAAIGPIIHEINIKDLYDIRLVPPKVIFYNYPRVKDDFDCFGNWIKLIKQDKDRAKAMLELYRIAPKPCLVFFEWKDHGLNLYKMAEKAGFRAQIISGDNSADQRKKAIQKLNSGAIEILFASRIFSKGVDIPEIRSCINAAGMKAAIPAMQKLGRGLRLVEGKESLIYLDFVDTAYPVNQKHSRMRFATYKKEGLEVFKCNSIAEILTVMESNTGNGEESSLPAKAQDQYLMNVENSGSIIRGKLVEIPSTKFMRDLFFHLHYTGY